MNKKEFMKKYNLTEEQFYGREKINGWLDLQSVTSLPDGFNPTVGGWLDLQSVKSLPDGFNPVVGGDLDLSSVTSLPDGFNPTVGGDLYLRRVTSLPDGFNPTVSGDLYLRRVTSLPDGFNPTVGGSLYLRGVTSLPDGFNPVVGGDLDLESVTSLPDGFNPVVGGDLDLQSVTSLPDGFNPTVGGWLDLRSVTSLPDGFNPVVGGWLYLRGVTSLPDGFNPVVGGSLYLPSHLSCQTRNLEEKEDEIIRKHKHKVEESLSWQNGKYRVFDGIFCEVLRKLKNAYKVKVRGKIQYVVTDGENYSHGDTIKQAKADLIYKISNRDSSAYKNLTLDSEVSFEEAIKMYRIITGACEAGTKHFVSTLEKVKKSYTIAEIIKLTAGQFGSDSFKKFFESRGLCEYSE